MAGRSEARDWVEQVRRLHEAGINDMELFPGQGLTGTAAASKLLEVRDMLMREFG
jgi:hypothetical protein